MDEPRGDFGLTDEPAAHVVRKQRLGAGDLQRHAAMEQRVDGLGHIGEAAPPRLTHDLKPAHGSGQCGRRLRRRGLRRGRLPEEQDRIDRAGEGGVGERIIVWQRQRSVQRHAAKAVVDRR